MQQKVYFNKKYLESVSPNGLLTAYGINRLITPDNTKVYISCNQICYNLGIDYKLKDKIADGIGDLCLLGIINICENISKWEWVIDTKKLLVKKDYFVWIYLDELQQIINNTNNRLDCKINMLKYFTGLVSTFNNSNNLGKYKGKVSTMPINTICKVCDIQYKSALRYNNELEDLKLIYVHRSEDLIMYSSGEIKQITNCYSRFEDADFCDRYANDYENNYGHHSQKEQAILKTNNAKEHRSLAQKSRWVDLGKTYDDETMQKIFEYNMSKPKY